MKLNIKERIKHLRACLSGSNRSTAVIRSDRNIFSKSHCLSCGEEMRKWITNYKVDDNGKYIEDTGECVSMCINNICSEKGIVHKDIQNINNIGYKVEFRL